MIGVSRAGYKNVAWDAIFEEYCILGFRGLGLDIYTWLHAVLVMILARATVPKSIQKEVSFTENM